MDQQYARLNGLSIGFALGVLWALCLFIMGIIAMKTGVYGKGFVEAVGSLYIGYHATFIGSIIGALYGFIDACIAGILFGWLYNLFTRFK